MLWTGAGRGTTVFDTLTAEELLQPFNGQSYSALIVYICLKQGHLPESQRRSGFPQNFGGDFPFS